MRKHILYLASGSSRRFGENKLLYSYRGKPLYLWGLDMLREVTKCREDCTLTVVSRYEPIRETAWKLGLAWADSPESDKGISYTIRAAISAIEPVEPDDYLLFVVADQPKLRPVSVKKLLAQGDAGVEGASLCYGEQPGNPTLFSARLVPELMALEGDTGGRKVLKHHSCVFVSAEAPEELEDIDTLQDMQT